MHPSNPNRKHLTKWPEILLALYWTSLLVATHWPKVPQIAVPGKDRTLHAVAYAILTSLLFLCTRRRLDRPLSTSVAGKIVLLTAACAGLDEILQPLTGRTADIVDWLADVLGVLATTVVYFAARRLRAARARR